MNPVTTGAFFVGILSLLAAAEDMPFAKFKKYPDTLLKLQSAENLFDIPATQQTCLRTCLKTLGCQGVDYGFGRCYGKSQPLAFGIKEHSTNFTHYAKKIDLVELNSRCSTFVDVHPNDPTNWLKECAYHIKKGGLKSSEQSVIGGGLADYYYKEQKSGMCTMRLASAFEGLAYNETILEVFKNHDLQKIHFGDISKQLPPTKFPALMSFPQTVRDVVEIITFAKNHDLQVSVKNSGHNYAGQSDVAGSIQMNLRNFPKYSYKEIYECEKGNQIEPLSGPPCQLAVNRSKGAVVRVGGGEGNDSIYRAVNDWNYRETRNKKYQVMGGGEGAIGAGGGWMMGGGLGMGVTDRLWGIGVDQVLELEMVLPCGTHVKFGPTKTTPKEGYLYPQTLQVEGRCNTNVHHDESQWQWVECDKACGATFEELWFAVRGGGGGTWGVVISAYHQLHDYAPWYGVASTPQNTTAARIAKLLEECIAVFGADSEQCKVSTATRKITSVWRDFITDFLYNPSAVQPAGVDTSISRACGQNAPVFDVINIGLKCIGEEAANGVLAAWRSYVPTNKYVKEAEAQGWPVASFLQSPDFFNMCQNVEFQRSGYISPALGRRPVSSQCVNVSFTAQEADQAAWRSPVGRFMSMSTAGASSVPGFNVVLPTALAIKRDVPGLDVPAFLSEYCFDHGLGGNIAVSSDGMDSMSPGFRKGALACQMSLRPWEVTKEQSWEMEKTFERLQTAILAVLDVDQRRGDDFPGWTELNHIQAYAGPLKEDWTKPCPFNFTRGERKEKCMTTQEAIWGTKNLYRLNVTKHLIDPDNMFSVLYGIGNEDVVEAPQWGPW